MNNYPIDFDICDIIDDTYYQKKRTKAKITTYRKNEMEINEKYEKCLKFIQNLYNLKFDTLVSIHEAIENQILSEKAEKLLKEINEFKEDVKYQ